MIRSFNFDDVHFLARMKQPVRSFSTCISKLENRIKVFVRIKELESKYLYLLLILRATFLFLCDLFNDYEKRIENQR